MFQFQLVPWKSDKQKSVVVFLVFSFPCHNSAAVQGYFGAMRKAVEDKKNRGSKARQAEKKWYNKRGREIQKEREREREHPQPNRIGQFVVTQRLPFLGTTTVNDVWQAHPYYWLVFTHAHIHTHRLLFPHEHEAQNRSSLCVRAFISILHSWWSVNKKVRRFYRYHFISCSTYSITERSPHRHFGNKKSLSLSHGRNSLVLHGHKPHISDPHATRFHMHQ